MEKKGRTIPTLNFFKFLKPTKSPEKLIQEFEETLKIVLVERRNADEKTNQNIHKHLEKMKDIIFGANGKEPQMEMIHKMCDRICKNDFIYLLIQGLPSVGFESRKSIVIVYSCLLRFPQILNHIGSKPEILFTLLGGYQNPEIALNYGKMLQESLKFEPFTGMILKSDRFFKMFQYVEDPTFHVASDAFITFRALLTGHKTCCSEFLVNSYDRVFLNYDKLLKSNNYVVRWQSLKLLSIILRNKNNSSVMHKFTNIPENLKMVLKLMTKDSKNIQYEAFQVLIAFIANRNKTNEMVEMFLKYQDRLVMFLKDFQEDRPDDEEFHKEKSIAINMIKDMKLPNFLRGIGC